MLVCPAHRFLIILPARCGTTSVKEAVKGRFRCKEIGPNHGVPVQTKHRPYFKVCLHRNPYSRTVSLWKHWLGRNPQRTYRGLDQQVNNLITKPSVSFAELVQRPVLRRLLLEVCPPVVRLTRAIKVNLWVRQENLAEDLQKLPGLVEPLLLPRRHKSTYTVPWREHYDDHTAELVRQLYAVDFDQFNYSTELPE